MRQDTGQEANNDIQQDFKILLKISPWRGPPLKKDVRSIDDGDNNGGRQTTTYREPEATQNNRDILQAPVDIVKLV